jgi:hypothetical protein
MQRETRKQLKVAYVLISVLIFLTYPLGLPFRVVLWFTDPIARLLAALVLVGFVPGVFFVWLYFAALVLALLAIYIVLWILLRIGTVSPVGAVVALALCAGLVAALNRIARGWWKEHGPRVTELGRTLVEFFAWLAFLIRDLIPKNRVVTHTRLFALEGANMSKDEQGLQPEIVRTPEGPVAKRDDLMSTDYEGWFAEALKRFRLQSVQRTLGEQSAVRRQLLEVRSQDLSRMKLEADIKHFPREDEIRSKQLTIEEIEHDMKIEELQRKQRELKEPKIPPPAPPRTDPIDEVLSKIRTKIRTVHEVRKAGEDFIKEGSLTEEEAVYVRREYGKMISDLRER